MRVVDLIYCPFFLVMKKSLLIIALLISAIANAQVDQVNINRIELMPNAPSPYVMRDWEQVTIGYDDLVYDISKTGDYLPLIFINEAGVNYPENKNFGLDTYVGTFSSKSGEAINVLPSLIGATLVGIDKSNQNSANWVLMGQDFFNKRAEENVYLNNYNGNSGTDWWYDIMPNIYFYQLHNLYPNIGDDAFQFTSIANQWLTAIKKMGGADTPWAVPFMDYRAWNLSTMTPLTEGVKEPEAAGGIAWLLYNAYIETGEDNYLKGAEWSMEYLNSLTANPSYELQLPYGIYAAAKMNAQIGTSYDIEKMLNWTFDRGDLRGWGTIIGNWNGVEASGLIGEANDQGNDYAFLMNGFQHASALVPMVRYDKRFARAIGKWMLNLANASRLFYPGFLPNEQQDASDWSTTNDPNGYIGYEGLREKLNGNQGPFSTGDALGAGWANTNLALYGSSSVGIFGGIIKTTNVEKILQLDLLKTDFFNEEAYPTFLYYNPYTSSKTVSINVGSNPVDLYNVLTENFVVQNVTGETNFDIGADNAVELVLVPAGGTVSYELNKLLINDIVVDYMQSSQVYNNPPRIKGLAASDELLEVGGTTTIYATTTDKEGETLSYTWSANGEDITESGETIVWTAPAIGIYQIVVTVADEQLNETSKSIQLEVVDHINSPPVIIDMFSNINNINPLEDVEITCMVEDADNDVLGYSWSASDGSITGEGNKVIWKSPSTEGISKVSVIVEDGMGGMVESKLKFLVKDYSVSNTGSLIAYYPFSGNADDHSGNSLNGEVLGAVSTEDLQGIANNAYLFNGQTHFIKVDNVNILNFTEAITVSCWIRSDNLSIGHESFILSHGSWQNRWKLSINSGKVRWTLNTSSSIKDVDSSDGLKDGENYHIVATYDGTYAILYINGKLNNSTKLDGEIKSTSYDFLIGRMLTDDNNEFNFNGLIDEVLVYDYALTPEDAISLMDAPIINGINKIEEEHTIDIYPNPTNGKIYLNLGAAFRQIKSIKLYNGYGKKIVVGSNKIIIKNNGYALDLSNYPNGIYYIEIEVADKRITKKIMVSK